MKALIIWQEIPEDVKYYIVEDCTEIMKSRLKECHSHVIGVVNDSGIDMALDTLSEAINDPSSVLRKIPESEVCECKPDFICVTGMLL